VLKLAQGTGLGVVLSLLSACTVGPVKPFATAPDRSNLPADEKSVWKASDEQDDAFQNMQGGYNDPALQTYIQGVVNKLYPEFDGTINVHLLKSPVPNAFMMANGSCYVQLGILPLLHDEAQLAIVLGHEGIHFTNRHGFQEHDYAVNTAVVGILVGSVIPIIPIAMAYSSIAGYSTTMESQADQQGYARFLKAGYAAAETPGPFEALDAYSTALDIKESYFFADHPKLQARISYFKAQAAKAPPGGIVGQADYLAKTEGAREWVLAELLSRQDYKSLVFLLGDKAHASEYPAWAPYYLACAYELRADMGDDALAEQAYRDTIAKAPDYAPAYEGLGKELMRRGGHDPEAAGLLETYLKLAPNAPDRSYIQSYITRLTAPAATATNTGK
jgi:predicted Zn-dependent protease